ncbi:hypothetical protein [Streptomyces sp. TRM70350]|uniref:hypothetical protein n=1 Tax=Streptomyces sp. TRM70350 TaxID=2856165 RepID=UPI001C469BE1|nr:hypothetical protein [Streptomyces sp. TRM70350]MBV7697425.1 hypothetical protein [Streptomyces sp. TRM70350]
MHGTPEDFGEVQQRYLLRLAVTRPLLLVSAPRGDHPAFRVALAAARAEMRSRVCAAGCGPVVRR